MIAKCQEGYRDNKIADKTSSYEMNNSPRNGGFGLVPAKQMKTATGVKNISPERIATERSVAMYKDNMKRIVRDQEKKAHLKRDLEIQMQEKIFKRENERLYMDDK